MNEKITLAQLIDLIAEETGESKQAVHVAITACSDIIGEGLRKDGTVNISGLGKFMLKWYDTKPGRNPQTGEDIVIPGHNLVIYRASSNLKKYINRKYEHLKPVLIEEDNVKEKTEKVSLSVPADKKEDVSADEKAESIAEEPKEPAIKPKEEPRLVGNKTEEKKQSYWWLWLVLLALIVVVIYFLWPKVDNNAEAGSPADAENTVVTDKPFGDLAQETQDQDQPAGLEESSEGQQASAEGQMDSVNEVGWQQPTEEEDTFEESSPPALTYSGGTYKVPEGERLRVISTRFYNNPTLWPVIFAANNEQMKNPDLLRTGMTITVPAIEGKPGNFTQSDKKLLAESFTQTYLSYKAQKPEKALYYLWVAAKLNVPGVLDKFKTEVDMNDIETVMRIDGEPDFKE
jgi:nucleoid DNA-binding protein/nucleoid-associated protein YgaU